MTPFRFRNAMLIAACAAAPAAGQDEAWRAESGDCCDWFGVTAVATIGDVNGDGAREVLVGAPAAANFAWDGRLIGLDGRTGSELFSVVGGANGLRRSLGYSIAALGDDSDGDGIEDFFADGESDAGPETYLFSGRDRSVLLAIADFGPLEAVDDVDGDSIRDIVVGSYNSFDVGVKVYSSADGTLVRQFVPGPTGSSLFGTRFAVLGDVDQDGSPDILIADPGATSYRGAALVRSIRDGRLLKSFKGTRHLDKFGVDVEALGDLDQDGVVDFAVGSEERFHSGGLRTGIVRFYSGATFAEIHRIESSESRGALTLGRSAGDVDADGFQDVLLYYRGVGSPRWIHSGRTFAPLVNVKENFDWTFGYGESLEIHPCADLDGDGYGEILWSVSVPIDSTGLVGVSRGASCFLSARANTIRFDPIDGRYEEVASPPPPGSPPGVKDPESLTTFLTAAGFGPSSALVVYLISDNGVPKLQPVITTLTDGNGDWSGAFPHVPNEPHHYVFQAFGVDAAGNPLVTPHEVVDYL